MSSTTEQPGHRTDPVQEYRETFASAVRHLGLTRQDVIRLTERLTGQPWSACGPEELALVVEHLRAAGRRALANRPADSADPPCAA
jgi:hypothetical protein